MTIHNPRALRDAFGIFPTGVTVVTANGAGGQPIGYTANSFSSVSLDPPLLLVCLAKTSTNYKAMTSASGFAVNVLAETQKEVSNTFASKSDDRFADVDWQHGPHGSPILGDTAAWFDCSMHEVIDAGDHAILIGRVEAFEAGVANGLGYVRGAYFTPALEARAVDANANVVVSAIVERGGQVLLERDRDGLHLPSRFVLRGAPNSELLELLAEMGIPASVGFIYSFYEDTENGVQHMAYHCTADDGESALGEFYSLSSETLAQVADNATRHMLRRLEAESRMGNYGIYFGDHKTGEVRRLFSEVSL